MTGEPRAPLLSPGGFLRLAGFLALLFGLLHLLGLRSYTAVFSGTIVVADAGGLILGRLLGVTYALTYLGAVVAAPVLVIGALLFGAWEMLLRRSRRRM